MNAPTVVSRAYARPASSPAEFGKLIADETEKWGKVIRAAGIRAD
jgi:tripartite-type tricarboxylate transporter receptor subunit TctC